MHKALKKIVNYIYKKDSFRNKNKTFEKSRILIDFSVFNASCIQMKKKSNMTKIDLSHVN